MKKLYSKNTAVIIIALIIILFACQKTNENNIPPAPLVTMTTASVAGRITDLNNAPMSGASVAAGESTTTTDASGQFTIKDIQLDKDAGYVKVTKAGYFSGSRTFLVNGNTTNNIKIQMIPKTVSGTVASSSGGNIDITGGAKINFTANSIVNAASNKVYSGDASVAGYYLNPADANFREFMPGDLRGIRTTDKESILRSFGMLSVEMNDAGGQKLQLATGKTATITIPIPSAMQTAAPATISLWYFDETKGKWKEEGTAIKQGTNYVGTVSHFSFWTTGQLGTSVRLDVTLIVKNDSSGTSIALTNKLVTITSANYGTTNGYTDNSGKLSGLVPANDSLTMKVFNDCGGIVYTQKIGPFSIDTDLGIVNVTGNNLFPSLFTSTITGTVVNCANDAVNRGSVQITIGSNTYKSVVTNGNYSISFARCDNSSSTLATLIIYDSIKNQLGSPQTINITSGVQYIGKIEVCGASTSPIADFTYLVGNTSPPVTVAFTNTSTNASSYLWVFGDGSFSALENPVHIYTVYGNIAVSLTATGPNGSNIINKVINISGTIDSSYINLTMNGTTYTWAYPDINANHLDSSGGAFNSTQIQGAGNNWINFYILNDNASPGNHNVTLSAIINGKSYPNNNVASTVTEFGLPGENIVGTSSGQLRELDSTTNIPFTLAYKVKRNK